jgi:hypothetical protein
VDIDIDGGMKSEMKHRVSEGENASVVLMKMSNRELSRDANICMYEGIVVPALFYGGEEWATGAVKRRQLEVIEMKCIRAIY